MNLRKSSPYITEQICQPTNKVYFVHSYRAIVDTKNMDWVLTTTNYGPYEFISSVQKGNVFGTQFHPEKSGQVGLSILKRFLDQSKLFIITLTLYNSPLRLFRYSFKHIRWSSRGHSDTCHITCASCSRMSWRAHNRRRRACSHQRWSVQCARWGKQRQV